VKLDTAGRVEAGDDGRTSNGRVFVAGDARRGASLIVWAIAEGRRVASSVRALLEDQAPPRRTALPVLPP
jgi:glutamate synthase (NADPH/NADH) small chain